ncbi:hypothetical protein BS47DRAFT_1351297 [Hydnum rufescens UP504]|uniref:Uncharacterized protein n=1 Tax=Hydnum rufescens UP504 TaxID=1448309 RepID=A0A9P6ALD5_9AGAM|nr:hypothetical protein BS47DRAFT_1351297 [Hydnum rufescens UP504]
MKFCLKFRSPYQVLLSWDICLAPLGYTRCFKILDLEWVVASLKHALSLVALSLPDWHTNTIHLSAMIMDSRKNWPSQLRLIVCDKGRPSLDCVNVLDGRAMGTIIDHATGMLQMLPC